MIDINMKNKMNLMLPKEFGEKWVKALRSGDFKKCIGKLYKNGSYCALGVVGSINGVNNEDLIMAGGNLQSYKFKDNLPECFIKDEQQIQNIIFRLNDGIYEHQENNFKEEYNVEFLEHDEKSLKEYSFDEIADWIETNVKFV